MVDSIFQIAATEEQSSKQLEDTQVNYIKSILEATHLDQATLLL